MERSYTVEQSQTSIKVETADDGYRVSVGANTYVVALRQDDNGVLTLDVDGRQIRAVVANDGQRRWVSVAGVPYVLDPAYERRGTRHASGGEDSLTAQMPGQVAGVYITPGDYVERGQKLVLLEAMKMELQVTAPHAGRVRAVRVGIGDIVKRGQTLVELEGTSE
jgi:acetyl/propionyl-CoA carboxylase alpha subunit